MSSSPGENEVSHPTGRTMSLIVPSTKVRDNPFSTPKAQKKTGSVSLFNTQNPALLYPRSRSSFSQATSLASSNPTQHSPSISPFQVLKDNSSLTSHDSNEEDDFEMMNENDEPDYMIDDLTWLDRKRSEWSAKIRALKSNKGPNAQSTAATGQKGSRSVHLSNKSELKSFLDRLNASPSKQSELGIRYETDEGTINIIRINPELALRLIVEQILDVDDLNTFLFCYRKAMKPTELVELLTNLLSVQTDLITNEPLPEAHIQKMHTTIALILLRLWQHYNDHFDVENYIAMNSLLVRLQTLEYLKPFTDAIEKAATIRISELESTSIGKSLAKNTEERKSVFSAAIATSSVQTRNKSLSDDKTLPMKGELLSTASSSAQSSWRESPLSYQPPFQTPEAIDPHAVASIMINSDSVMFSKLRRGEFVSTAWAKENKHLKSPTIVALTERFTKLSLFTASVIVCGSTAERRARFYDQLGATSRKLHKHQDFQSAYAIFLGMQNRSVTRLKKTMEEVKFQTDRLTEVYNLSERQKTLRTHISSCSPPLVPFVAPYLGLLAGFEEKGGFMQDGMADWRVWKSMHKIIDDLVFFARTCTEREMDKEAMPLWMQELRGLEDDEINVLSRRREEPEHRFIIDPSDEDIAEKSRRRMERKEQRQAKEDQRKTLPPEEQGIFDYDSEDEEDESDCDSEELAWHERSLEKKKVKIGVQRSSLWEESQNAPVPIGNVYLLRRVSLRLKTP
ncbi:putative RasGEF domain containing protein [Blattamonas nauphoetae]|uniref:RasGEF domain containing protein n=1 Tax=Blattamonas nauphoetae TaxID=2049346 RepID=A0ABQ9YMM4_9EUKA|nr:putative RasGEF domain containing protein [Blattamonas nauphoetae]